MKIVNNKIEGINYTSAKSYGGKIKPSYIIAHYTAGRSFQKSLRVLTENKVSAHLLIGKAGELVQMVPFNIRAFHAGRSKWGNVSGLNGFSLGVEQDNSGVLTKIGPDKWKTWYGEIINDPAEVYTHTDGTHWTSYTHELLERSIDVFTLLCKEYNIPPENILNHSDIAPGRKQDCGPAYPMEKIRRIVKERL